MTRPNLRYPPGFPVEQVLWHVDEALAGRSVDLNLRSIRRFCEEYMPYCPCIHALGHASYCNCECHDEARA